MRTRPYPFQIEGARSIDRFHGRALLADEMGLGKTIQSLYWTHKRRRYAFPVLVICPASLKYNWQREIEKHLGYSAEVCEGMKAPRGHLLDPSYTIINYDILKPWRRAIDRLQPRTVILDEAQKIKNRRSKRYRQVKSITRNVDYLIACSGTPLMNRIEDLWTILNLLRPDLYESKEAFMWEYAVRQMTPFGWKVIKAKNQPQLHAELREHLLIRRLKGEVLDQLPPATRCVIPLAIANRAEYGRAHSNFLSWLGDIDRGRARRARKSVAFTRSSYLKRYAARLKFNAVVEWINEWLEDNDGKMVVFAKHHDYMRNLHNRIPSILLTGDTAPNKRLLTIDRFQESNERILVAQIYAAGEGLNITCAQATAFAEIEYVPAVHLQAEKRVDRIGQTVPTTSYYLVGRGTIEERLCEILQSKQGMADTILDGAEEDDTDLDLWTMLVQSMKGPTL